MGHVLAEPFLEGKFQKWNNNAGAVKTTRVGNLGVNMGVIGEDDEEDEVRTLPISNAWDLIDHPLSQPLDEYAGRFLQR